MSPDRPLLSAGMSPTGSTPDVVSLGRSRISFLALRLEVLKYLRHASQMPSSSLAFVLSRDVSDLVTKASRRCHPLETNTWCAICLVDRLLGTCQLTPRCLHHGLDHGGLADGRAYWCFVTVQISCSSPAAASHPLHEAHLVEGIGPPASRSSGLRVCVLPHKVGVGDIESAATQKR
jgi:hypothetical protein